ncbi:MAG: acetyl-CoA carboxylase biotin carboxyl carrier protein subunit [Bifidobacterium adolescentis]
MKSPFQQDRAHRDRRKLGYRKHPRHPIESTITGTVVRWLADDGAHVEENEPIVVLEAMKMETEITAPVAGILHRSAQVGDTAAIRRPPRRHQLTRRPADTAAGRRVNRTPLTRNASQSQKQNPDHGRNAT